MFDHFKSFSGPQSLRIAFLVFIGFLLHTQIGYGQIQEADCSHGVLQGSIHLQPAQAIPGDQTGKIQPGTAVKLVVTVENKGQQKSPAGELWVRYAFAHPLENEAASIIFETEKKPLPAIEPGKKADIVFETPHQIPSLFDFVRHDWPIREYQAIASVNNSENIIGTLAITFSAYYYPGIKKEFPVKISP